MAKVSAKDLVIGNKIWVAGYSKWADKPLPMEIVIKGLIQKDIGLMVMSDTVNESFNKQYHEYKQWFPSDYGIEGHAYDSRCCQAFTTEQEMWEAITMWAGRNPNFVDKSGDDLEQTDDFVDYDEMIED